MQDKWIQQMNRRHHSETIMMNINKLAKRNIISLKHAILLNPKSFLETNLSSESFQGEDF